MKLLSMFGSRTGDSSKQDRGNGNEKGSNSRLQRKVAFADPMSEVHLTFFNAALPLFTHFNAFFFAEK